jgi:hypothetical protein
MIYPALARVYTPLPAAGIITAPGLLFFQDIFYIAAGLANHFLDFGPFFRRHLVRPPADQAAKLAEFVHRLVEIIGVARAPPAFYLAFDFFNDFLLFFQEFLAFFGNGVNLFPVALGRADITHIVEHLEGRVNAAGAGRIKAVEKLFQRAYYLVAVAG